MAGSRDDLTHANKGPQEADGSEPAANLALIVTGWRFGRTAFRDGPVTAGQVETQRGDEMRSQPSQVR
jgi:hypothetical protein